MDQEKIKVGDRVETTLAGSVVQGVVKSIYVQTTRGGPAAVFKVAVDRRDGAESEVEEVDSPAHLWHKPGSLDPCVDCGVPHNQPRFNTHIMSLYEQYQKADDAERSSLLQEIGQSLVDSIKDTDLSFPEALHEMVSEVKEYLLETNHLRAKLGRMVVAYIQDSTRLKSIKDLFQGTMTIRDLQELLGGGNKPSNPLDALLDAFGGSKKGGGTVN